MAEDVNKGDDTTPNVRARLVAKEIKADSRLDMFAATPPLEAKKFLFSRAATSSGLGPKRKGHKKLIFIDIKRACMYAPEIREIYVELPPQDAEEGMCGKLKDPLVEFTFMVRFQARVYVTVNRTTFDLV